MVLGKGGFWGWGFIYFLSFASSFSSVSERIGHGVGVGRALQCAEDINEEVYLWKLKIRWQD